MKKFLLLITLLFFVTIVSAQRLQNVLDSLRQAGNYPGLSVAITFKDKTIALASGLNDKEKNIPLKTSDRLLQGSVGKTYVAAIALQLVKNKILDLDKKVIDYLGGYSWYASIPNASTITVRMLMNHTSGVMRYEFKPKFLQDLTASPGKSWKPAELLQYILGEQASFAAGEGWEYSDSNYILLGMILEKLTGTPYYQLLDEKILTPYRLHNTFPSDQRKLSGLAMGYAGEQNEFGGKDKVIDETGLFIINPQFEWTGGGVYSTTSDLSKWGYLLYTGKIVDTSVMFGNSVAAKLGRDTRYAQGVIIRPTPLGTGYGHSGFFPGYMTELLYFPQHDFSIAVQTNSSDYKNFKLSLLKILLQLATEATVRQ